MRSSELSDADLATMQRQLLTFENSPLHQFILSRIDTQVIRIVNALKSKSTPLDEVRFNQGELAQATRDILLVEGLSREVGNEIAKRQKEPPK